jgi:hypothetical protein
MTNEVKSVRKRVTTVCDYQDDYETSKMKMKPRVRNWK